MCSLFFKFPSSIVQRHFILHSSKFSFQYIYLTGGCASFDNLTERLERELLAMRPFQSKFTVYKAKNPVHDAWYGARKWALSEAFPKFSVTRAEYEEMGGEYLKESCISNQYFPTPITTKNETVLTPSASQSNLSRVSSSSSLIDSATAL